MLSLVIPVYNEQKLLGRLTPALAGRLAEKAEVIVVDDASSDRTRGILEALSSNTGLRFMENGARIGKGASVARGFAASSGDKVVFSDLDIALSPGFERLLDDFSASLDGFDLVIAERKTRASPARALLSCAFNFAVRLLFGSRIRDHQCGLKGFKKETMAPVISGVRSKGYFWDAELLIAAQRAGMNIKSMDYRERESRINIGLANVVLDMMASLLSRRLRR